MNDQEDKVNDSLKAQRTAALLDAMNQLTHWSVDFAGYLDELLQAETAHWKDMSVGEFLSFAAEARNRYVAK